MKKNKTYENLTNEYFSICKLKKKLDFSGALMQFSFITVLLSWKPAQIGLYKIAAPILLSFSIFYFFRNIYKFRIIEAGKSQAIFDGLEIEKQSANVRFFHDILEKFNLKQILLTRLVLDLLAFGILGYLTYEFLIELAPSLAVPQKLFIALFSCALSSFACKEYYEALKPLTIKKNFITTQNEEAALDTIKDSDKHRVHAIEYKKLAQKFQKSNIAGIVEMLVGLVPLYYLSKSNIPYSKPLGCAFALVAIFIMARDYTRSKNLDANVVKLVLKGIKIEKKNPSFNRFFHNVLDEFSIVKILVSRSICTVLCVYYLSNSISKILLGEASTVGNHKVLLGLIGVGIGVITCGLYYNSYKEFDELKSQG